jgi:hypothetical protein
MYEKVKTDKRAVLLVSPCAVLLPTPGKINVGKFASVSKHRTAEAYREYVLILDFGNVRR